MKRIITLIFLLILSFEIRAQIQVLDSISRKPIPFVEFFSEEGTLLGICNFDGYIMKELILNSHHLSITLNHPDYQKKNILVKHILNNTDILLLKPTKLTQQSQLLPEITVKAQTPKFLRIKAFFRSIQFNNQQPQYYMDGIVEYYIATTSMASKNSILESRSFREKQIPILKEKGLIQLDFNLVGVPYLEDFLTAKNLEKKYIIHRNASFSNLKKDTISAGIIKLDSHKTSLDLAIYSEKNINTMRMFGVESNLTKYFISANYSTTKSNFELKDLNWFKEIREYKIKSKKYSEESVFNTVHEVFVLEKDFVNDRAKSTNSFYSFQSKNKYESKFWELQNIPPISEEVQKFIESKMIELK